MGNDLSLNVLQPASKEWTAGRIETLLSHYFRPNTDDRIEEAAMIDWLRTLAGFSREQISSACEGYLKAEALRRPTPAAIRKRITGARETGGPSQQPMGRGDRGALTADERFTLDTRILPTARAWLEVPALRQHAVQTLEYWGEPTK